MSSARADTDAKWHEYGPQSERWALEIITLPVTLASPLSSSVSPPLPSTFSIVSLKALGLVVSPVITCKGQRTVLRMKGIRA